MEGTLSLHSHALLQFVNLFLLFSDIEKYSKRLSEFHPLSLFISILFNSVYHQCFVNELE